MLLLIHHSACAGNFSFPSVPPEAKLIYEMELVDFEPVIEVGVAVYD